MQRVTETDLKRGEVVYLREHSEGGWCLLVGRGGLTHTVMRNDNRPKRFDSRWEARSYCQRRGFDLQVWDKPVPKEERRLLPAPEDDLPLPPLDPVIEEFVSQMLKRKLRDDLVYLALLRDLQPHVRDRFVSEIRRRKALGNKSCLCPQCINSLSYDLRYVEGEIARLKSWLGPAAFVVH